MNVRLDSSSITLPALAGITGQLPASGGGFADALAGAMGEVEQSQRSAQTAAADFINGRNGDVHTVALATQRAELSMEMFQQVRNKFVQAYQEIMKTQM